jgi:tripartite-type tricarboxylate transporter receptor subunit TctC
MSSRSARLCGAVAALWVSLAWAAEPAEKFPSKPLRLIVPGVPGSPPDLRGRLVGQRLAEALHQPVVVENRPGANGAIAAAEVARAASDGHTLFMGNISSNALNELLNPGQPSRPAGELIPVTRVSAGPLVVVVPSSVRIVSLSQLIALAKSNPARLTYTSWGKGSLTQLFGELLKGAAGVDIVEIPYKSTGAGIPDVLAGQVSIGFDFPAVVGPHVKSGKLVALAITSTQRLPILPDVPTMAEAGYQGMEAMAWQGLFVPPGTPDAVVRRLHREVAQLLAQPEIRSQIINTGSEIGGDPPEEFAAFIRSEIVKWGKVIQERGIRLD